MSAADRSPPKGPKPERSERPERPERTERPERHAREVPLCIPDMGDEEIAAVADVIRSGWLAHGPKNKEFETLFAEYHGAAHAVSLNSCASALFLALHASGIRGEVILPSFTFVASANAVVAAGGTPVFADVAPDTCNLDPEAVEAALTDRTEAIMPVHYAGHAAQMGALASIAAKRKLLLVEDSAEAIGATWNGKRTGGWGTGCFSFYPTKNLSTGEGGMLTTNDAALAEKVRAIAGHGVASSTWAREKKEKPWLRAATFAGYNFRMSNVLAAIGVVQMGKLERMNEARRTHAMRYNELLDAEAFELPPERPGCRHVYQMYTVKLRRGDRTKLLAELRGKGIGASVHFDPPVHTQPYYAGRYGSGWKLPVTERLAATILTLPIYPGMTPDDVAYVAQAANQAAKSCV